MAKKENTIVVDGADINLVSPKLEQKVKDLEKEDVTVVSEDITMVTPTVEKPVVKMVKIKAKQNHKCFIGSEWYYLIQGKQYNVPENVKNILAQADLLLPL